MRRERATDATVYPAIGRALRRLALACLAAVTASAASGQPVPVDRLIAVVDQRALTATDLRLAIRLGSIPGSAPNDAALVEQLVTRELIRIEADRFAVVEPTPAEVDARLTALAAGRDVGGWLEELASLGASEDRVRRMVADDLRVAAYLEQRFTSAAQPTDGEAVARATAEGGTSPTDVAAAGRALLAERRQALIDDWVAALRRRANVRVVARQ
jgi:hypothetical protein